MSPMQLEWINLELKHRIYEFYRVSRFIFVLQTNFRIYFIEISEIWTMGNNSRESRVQPVNFTTSM
jgi:hypothetical protein